MIDPPEQHIYICFISLQLSQQLNSSETGRDDLLCIDFHLLINGMFCDVQYILSIGEVDTL